MTRTYNGGLTREQFLFYEIRQVASLLCDGLTREQIAEKVEDENLFQFPTERMIANVVRVCFRRIDALGSEVLIEQLAHASPVVAKQINLYAMMKYNRLVWDFMTTVIGEKFRTQDMHFSTWDLNEFMFRLREQDEDVATWSDSTVSKIKQVLKKALIECDYLTDAKATELNYVIIEPVLEDAIRASGNTAALSAFNCFR